MSAALNRRTQKERVPAMSAKVIPVVSRQDLPLRIVSAGGGSGLATLLRGLKPYARSNASSPAAVDLTAVVTVTDDGGSSGRLRRELDVLPPGDIRNCIVALSEDETLLSKLFEYRFSAGRGLRGHSFGNLFLTALSDITGDFPKAVKVTSEILAIAGRIFPSTNSKVTLEATLEDGTVVAGESRISKSRTPIRSVALKPLHVQPLAETCRAINEADLVTLGPGSLYTSVIPNLLVDGIPESIRKSRALTAYIVNLMWQPGETMHYSASDHVRALWRHAKIPLDFVVVNTSPITTQLQRKYARQHVHAVEIDLEELNKMRVEVVAGPLFAEGAVVRHDAAALARVILELALESRRRRKT